MFMNRLFLNTRTSGASNSTKARLYQWKLAESPRFESSGSQSFDHTFRPHFFWGRANSKFGIAKSVVKNHMSSGTAYWGIAQIEKHVCSTPTTGTKNPECDSVRDFYLLLITSSLFPLPFLSLFSGFLESNK